MPGVKFRAAHADSGAMRQAAVLTLIVVVVGVIPAGASANTPLDRYILRLMNHPRLAAKKLPALLKASEAQTKGQSPGSQYVFFEGAIMGYENYNVCFTIQEAPDWFESTFSAKLAQRDDLMAELRTLGLTTTSVAKTVHQGMLFGCSFFDFG